MPDKAKKLAALISEMRGTLSQRKFSEALGVHYSKYQRWEWGLSFPSVEDLEKIAKQKGWTLDEINAYLSDEPMKKTLDFPQLLKEVRQLSHDEAAQIALAAIQVMQDDKHNRFVTDLRDTSLRLERGNCMSTTRISRMIQGFMENANISQAELETLASREIVGLDAATLREIQAGRIPNEDELGAIAKLVDPEAEMDWDEWLSILRIDAQSTQQTPTPELEQGHNHHVTNGANGH